jgi:1-acyl-sn-glycerol-3-phosphate acyltransferase
VRGRENLPVTGPYLLAPVHRSNVDWLVVARVTRRRLRYMVKGEVFQVTFIGRLLEALGTFKVNRGAADREALQRSIEVLKAGEPMVVFPEGTRGAGPVVGELRDGVAYLALRAGVPVIPVGMSALERSMPRGSKFPRPVRVRLVVGPPIYPDAAVVLGGNGRGRVSRTATRALSAEVRAGIQAAFDAAERRLPSAPTPAGADPAGADGHEGPG